MLAYKALHRETLRRKEYFTRRADGYPGPGIIPADRRNAYVTLQFKI
ncbi:MAG: hypothetical protein ACTHMM_22345 [Agriterribacter sp.]